ncbi:SubName: Full=Uncharacterized protein {ECO:0000313/EMBL:CCA74709.1} [Serendipita indica DSM 11827]|uniref:Uncharacterized protein n=1 Tax=Serendipita indica (strain DSM 11827) TaxID=1109443 RepID=G4TTR6_SERID|nr:SubName: Full=Uncharacterized protein {ECO:0000313/EMBL:CCA74709.1} [Serendipita indica DSM 11827]CCA74709.1 hypothetical protein PIIN_08669 [Serendipita indica DSM 11827]
MFASLVAYSALLLGTGALALPQVSSSAVVTPESCGITSYGPFKLFATRADLKTHPTYEVRLVANSTTLPVTSYMAVSTTSSCTNCGVVPSYWTLINKTLNPYDPSLPSGVHTINKPVVDHQDLEFLTSKVPPPASPIYCGVQLSADTSPLLSVYGSSSLFTMCAFTSRLPPVTLLTIIYDTTPVHITGYSCYPVKLTMQSIGIVP